ncbi:redoxin domain-containing protein, partial [Salmonella enterica]|nr:redoxin domain-containing protein [Salmonella enterica]
MTGKLRRWLGEVAIFLALLIAVMVIMDVWRAPQVPPAFAATPLRTLTEESTTLAALSEKRPVLLYFWASWCGVCRLTTPAVARLEAEGENVMTVALRSGDDAEVARWLTRKGVAFP